MTPHVYQYEDPEKQTVHFRGYVKVYHGQRFETVSCDVVRRNRLRAICDAKKLVLKLRNEKT